MSTYHTHKDRAEAYRLWRTGSSPDMEALAKQVGSICGHGLNTQLNRQTMNTKLREKCIRAGIPEEVLPPATKTKAQLETELRETRIQLHLCWDALDGCKVTGISSR